MAEDSEKPQVPAWQEAAKQSQSTTRASDPDASAVLEAAKTVPDAATSAMPTAKPQDGVLKETEQREQMRRFLQEADVVKSSEEKKRAFLLSKDVPAHLIDEELGNSAEAITTQHEKIQKENEQAFAAPYDDLQVQAPPPIITYPEFLANAHRPAPLVTPARVLATTYVASATAALAYAASTYLVKPMIASLTDARHDLASHSNDKVEHLNARLAQVASKVPGEKVTREHDSDSSDSDPTELFARDTGTQTDTNLQSDGSKVTIQEPNPTIEQTEKLKDLQKHLYDMLAGVKKEEEAAGEREENTRQLRHYLDGLAYGNSGLNVWSNTNGQFGWEQTAAEQHREKEKKNDVIEELKKEIRGVKGVLLSAKRFPPTGRTQPASPSVAPRRVDAPA